MNQKKFNVTMLGPRGVGKTSILAGMYDQFEKSAKNANLSLTPDAKSSARLSQKLGELKAQTDTFRALNGIAGTADSQFFNFELGLQFQEPEMNIVFQDYPGGWFSGEDSEKSKIVENAIRDSQMIILAIDSPALMAQKGKWNESINQPRQMSDFFKRAFRGIDSKKLVLLVPVKCESYVQDKDEIQKLSLAIKKSYNSLITQFQSDILSKKLAVGIAPIQTLGNVRFSYYKSTDNIPEACFTVCKNHNSPYDPKNVEQVIFYMLNFVLSQYLYTGILGHKNILNKGRKEVEYYMKNRSWMDRAVDSVFDTDSDKRDRLEEIGDDLQNTDKKINEFGQSIQKVIENRKEGVDGFELIQGSWLFDLDGLHLHDNELEREY